MAKSKLSPEAQAIVDNAADLMNARLDLMQRTHGLDLETMRRLIALADKLSTKDRARVLAFAEGLADWPDEDAC